MDFRSQYKFGRTLGAGTYGIVREADCGGNKFAIKIILKKNVKGNEKMVYDEMVLLQRMKHPHIVRFHDWFESKVRRSHQELYEPNGILGQVLYCYSAGHWWRTVRPNLRIRQVYGERCRSDDPASPRGR